MLASHHTLNPEVVTRQVRVHTPSLIFQHPSSSSAITGYATEGPLLISMHLSTKITPVSVVLSAPSTKSTKVWVLPLWKQHSVRAHTLYIKHLVRPPWLKKPSSILIPMVWVLFLPAESFWMIKRNLSSVMVYFELSVWLSLKKKVSWQFSETDGSRRWNNQLWQ